MAFKGDYVQSSGEVPVQQGEFCALGPGDGLKSLKELWKCVKWSQDPCSVLLGALHSQEQSP